MTAKSRIPKFSCSVILVREKSRFQFSAKRLGPTDRRKQSEHIKEHIGWLQSYVTDNTTSLRLSQNPQIGDPRSSQIRGVVERPDYRCGDDLVISDSWWSCAPVFDLCRALYTAMQLLVMHSHQYATFAARQSGIASRAICRRTGGRKHLEPANWLKNGSR